ncbi:MAG: TlpA disulfide reductase family protein [Planctomycetota bacterium]
MPLAPGTRAPEIFLGRDDKTAFILSEHTRENPVILAFFKRSCPTCQLTFPFLERLYQRMDREGATLIGISQDLLPDVAEFRKQLGITFPIAIDAPDYVASRAYDVRNVPTLCVVETDGLVSFTSVGFVKDDLERLNRYWAEAKDWLARPLFEPGDQAPAMRPG